MREITNHIVNGDQAPQLKIEVTDEPGQGGANHRYEVSGCDWSKNPSADPEWFPITLYVLFQNGPIKERGVNGVTNEALLAIVIDRLRALQAGPFASLFNENALFHCERALEDLKQRTLDRIWRGVEGENKR